MFGKKSDPETIRSPFSQMNGLLDKGCSFRGRLTFDGTIQINGDFEGEIFSDGTLIIGAEAHVSAKVSVGTLVIYGQLQGEIEAKTRVELHVPAKVRANIMTPRLTMEDGVFFLGHCQMDESLPETSRVHPAVADGDDAPADDDVLVM